MHVSIARVVYTCIELHTAAAATNPSRSLIIKPNLGENVPQDILKAKKKLNMLTLPIGSTYPHKTRLQQKYLGSAGKTTTE